MERGESSAIATPATEWVGRVDEEKALARHVAVPGANVLVVGLGGIGKSALVERVASQLRARVHRIDGARGPDWIRALEVALAVPRGERGREARLRALARALDALSDTVVVLDGADARLDEWAELVSRRSAPPAGATLVATARVPVDSARVETLSLGPLSGSEGASLYRLHGGAHHSEEAVEAVVRATGGIPLSLVIAARWSDVLGPRAIAERLERRVARSGSRAVREVALDDVLAGAWDALSDDGRHVLRALARFVGAASVEALEAVSDGLVSGDVIDVVSDLIARGLVSRAESDGEPELMLPLPVRRFVEGALSDGADGSALDERLRAWLLEASADAARESYGPHADQALATLERIAPDVERALSAPPRADDARERATLALRVVDAVFFRDALPLDTRLFPSAVEAAITAGDLALEAAARVALARAVLERGDSREAEQHAREALEVATRAGSKRAEGDARRALAWALLSRGQALEAREQLEAARVDLESLAEVRSLADVHCALGLTLLLTGDVDAAQRHVAAALSLHATAGDGPRLRSVEAIARTVGLSSAADESEGERAERRSSLEASVTLQRERGHVMREALDAFRLALLEREDGAEATFAAWRLHARRAALAAGMPQALADQVERMLDAPPAPCELADIAVGPEARWVRIGATEHSLRRHGSMRRVLDALVDARLARPGEALSTDAVLAAGWPGERVLYAAGQYRVYTAIRRLRALGLDDALVTRDDGYLLAPSVAVARES